MKREMDWPDIQPLVELMRQADADVVVAALDTAVRFPLTADAWRSLAQETLELLERSVDNDALRRGLIATAWKVPTRSVRRWLHRAYEAGGSRDRDWSYRTLAEASDAVVAPALLRELEAAPSSEWPGTLELLARMPMERTGLSSTDVPEIRSDDPSARFWHAIVMARLGSVAPLEAVLLHHVEPPDFLHGNPWYAYQRIARVRPLPESLTANILEWFDLAHSPDAERVRDAGLLVWALTGIADAEGSMIEPPPDQVESRETVPARVWSDAEIEKAGASARHIIDNFDNLDAHDLPGEVLRALPPEDAGSFVRALLQAAYRRAAQTTHVPSFMISNLVVEVVEALPRSADLPVAALYSDWTKETDPAVDREQLAWILERAGAGNVLRALAPAPSTATFDFLALVGEVAAGTAGSPWRGAGPVGFAAGPPPLIDDERLAQSPPRKKSAPPGAPAPPPDRTIQAVLSAEGPKELDVESTSSICVRVECEDGAQPLAHAATVAIRPEPISVIVFLSNESVQLLSPVLQVVDAPTPGQPRQLEFRIAAREPGETRAIVHFQQGSTTLAMLTFIMRVLSTGATDETTVAEGRAAGRDPYDDGVVRIMIRQPTTDEPWYTYYVTSKLLGLVNAPYASPPFTGDGKVGELPKAYAQSVYRRIETEVLERAADARVLETRLERIGTDMCNKLLPEALIRELWKRRDEIQSIEITPIEPYMPWELLRLKHPEEGVDTRHLGEYRLVRTLGGREPARTLGRAEWRYVLGDYPNLLYAELPAERTFLTTGLSALGAVPKAIPPKIEDVLAALKPAEFDVLHFACHGEASLDAIDESALIIADRLTAGRGKVAVKIYPTDLEVDLSPRRPLVFLSACQSGRMAPSLTDFGGWPKVLVEARAGAMVGTSWAVHEKPAVAFATAFYQSLLRGETLGEAAGAGRAAARTKGDASWLAYTVYGWSSARMNA